MPAKSKKQFAKIALLYKQGKITKTQFDNFNKGVDYKRLPTRVKPKSKTKRKKWQP